MISSMPKWIWIGGFILSLFAGFINVLSLLIFQHQAVSHITGSVAQLGIYTSQFQIDATLHVLGVVVSFLCGAIISSLIIRDAVLSFGKRYGVTLILESAFIFIAIIGFYYQVSFADYFVSAACGLQNAMATTYSGAVLRTTHMTGVVTDLGIWIGNFFRGVEVSFINLRMYVALLLGFLIGSILGANLHSTLGYKALLLPASSIGIIGLVYMLIRIRMDQVKN